LLATVANANAASSDRRIGNTTRYEENKPGGHNDA
jgi:hypothetical protein